MNTIQRLREIVRPYRDRGYSEAYKMTVILSIDELAHLVDALDAAKYMLLVHNLDHMPLFAETIKQEDARAKLEKALSKLDRGEG